MCKFGASKTDSALGSSSVTSGAATVTAVVASQSTIVCITPAFPTVSSGPVELSVSSNAGKDFVNDFGLRFNVQQPAHIESLHPNSGPLAGGTEITVLGSGFINAPGIALFRELSHSSALFARNIPGRHCH